MIRAVVIALLMIVATPLASCHTTPGPRTVAEARPELAVAYEAGMRAWVWLDARNAALYEARADAVTTAILQHRPEFEAECGEMAETCMLMAYERLMADWEKESGYDVRTSRLESAREGLAAMHDVLVSNPKSERESWASAVRLTAAALSALVDELVTAKVGVPDIVAVGLAAIKRLA